MRQLYEETHNAGLPGKSLIIIITTFVIISACSDNDKFSKTIKIDQGSFKGIVSIEYNSKLSKYMVIAHDSISGTKDRIYTPYEIFQAEIGDINHDDKPDIFIGIIKPTPFDSLLRKRLFIFQIDRGYIRPLWLGSKLSAPFEAFSLKEYDDGHQTILAVEKQPKNLYRIREYEWDSFGLYFVKEIDDSLRLNRAKNILQLYQNSKINQS